MTSGPYSGVLDEKQDRDRSIPETVQSKTLVLYWKLTNNQPREQNEEG